MACASTEPGDSPGPLRPGESSVVDEVFDLGRPSAREQLISQLEETGAELKKSGLCAEWFDGVDKGVARVR